MNSLSKVVAILILKFYNIIKNQWRWTVSHKHKPQAGERAYTYSLVRAKPAIPRLTSATGNDPSNQYDHHLIQNKNDKNHLNQWENHRICSIICKSICGLYGWNIFCIYITFYYLTFYSFYNDNIVLFLKMCIHIKFKDQTFHLERLW